MPTWHQEKAGMPVLYHAALWTAYNPRGQLSVMRFATAEECMRYCEKTGDVALPPTIAKVKP